MTGVLHTAWVSTVEVAQWIEHQPTVREVMGLCPVRYSDFFVPPLCHVDQFTFHNSLTVLVYTLNYYCAKPSSLCINLCKPKITVRVIFSFHVYQQLYNDQINTHTLIGQSAMVYCAGKCMERSHVFFIIV